MFKNIHIKNRYYGGQEYKSGPVWELIPMGAGKDIRKGCRRVNMVEIICTHV
jgi:hypothetical protein